MDEENEAFPGRIPPGRKTPDEEQGTPESKTFPSASQASSSDRAGDLAKEDGKAVSPSQRTHAADGHGTDTERAIRLEEYADDLSDVVQDNASVGLDHNACSVDVLVDISSPASPAKSAGNVCLTGQKSSCSYSSSQRFGVKPLELGKARLGRLPSPTPREKDGRRRVREARESARLRHPRAAQALKGSKVTLSAR